MSGARFSITFGIYSQVHQISFDTLNIWSVGGNPFGTYDSFGTQQLDVLITAAALVEEGHAGFEQAVREAGQVTRSDELTSLVTAVLKEWLDSPRGWFTSRTSPNRII